MISNAIDDDNEWSSQLMLCSAPICSRMHSLAGLYDERFVASVRVASNALGMSKLFSPFFPDLLVSQSALFMSLLECSVRLTRGSVMTFSLLLSRGMLRGDSIVNVLSGVQIE
jgi:hypothetical protein